MDGWPYRRAGTRHPRPRILHRIRSPSVGSRRPPRHSSRSYDRHGEEGTGMARDRNSTSDRVRTSRRSFVKGLSAAGALLPALTASSQRGFAEDALAPYASAAIDWKQFAGQTITLAGAIHPWSNAIAPLLPGFTELTGINVMTDFQLETTFLGALPIRLARGSSTPDVFM